MVVIDWSISPDHTPSGSNINMVSSLILINVWRPWSTIVLWLVLYTPQNKQHYHPHPPPLTLNIKLTRYTDSTLDWYWTDITDSGQTLYRHIVHGSRLLNVVAQTQGWTIDRSESWDFLIGFEIRICNISQQQNSPHLWKCSSAGY